MPAVPWACRAALNWPVPARTREADDRCLSDLTHGFISNPARGQGGFRNGSAGGAPVQVLAQPV